MSVPVGEVHRGLRQTIGRLPDLFRQHARLVIGFSGGQDSTCLLHALRTVRPDLDLIAAHVDHALRVDSAESARQAQVLAESIGVQTRVERIDVAAYRAETHWSIQQAARAARYQALAAVVEDTGAAALLVAHTADDQAETVLLRLLRGSGLGGLAGMRLDEAIEPRRLGPQLAELDHLAPTLRVARPLLRIARAHTAAYCAELGLSVVPDPSNQSRAFTRNRVRLDLLPALEAFNPAIRDVLARTADLAGEDVAALDGIVADLHTDLLRGESAAEIEYDLPAWRAQPRALQRRLLRYGLARVLGDLVDVPSAPIEGALDVLRSAHAGQAYHLPYGVELCARTETFVLRRHGRARRRTLPKTWGRDAPRV